MISMGSALRVYEQVAGSIEEGGFLGTKCDHEPAFFHLRYECQTI